MFMKSVNKIIDAEHKFKSMYKSVGLKRVLDLNFKILKIFEMKEQELIDANNSEGILINQKHRQLFEDLIAKQITKFEDEKVDIEDVDHYEWVITYDLMKNPYTTTSGYSYERDSIRDYLQKDNRDPHTRMPASLDKLYENKALKRAIDHHKSQDK